MPQSQKPRKITGQEPSDLYNKLADSVCNSLEKTITKEKELSKNTSDYLSSEEYLTDEENKEKEKEKVTSKFIISENTRVGWGKLRGQNHSAFLKPKNRSYAQWVIDQGDGFRYNNSRKWILDNIKRLEQDIGNIPIKLLSKEQIQEWLKDL